VLTADDIAQYQRQGYLQVSGLIPDETVRAAREAMLSGVPVSGSDSLHAFRTDRAVLACFTKSLCSAAAQLADARKLRPPRTAYTITVFPTSTPWQWPSPHIDHSHERDRHRTFPPPFRVGCLIYLTDTPPHTGGTVVWPESHRQLEAAARAEPGLYEYMSSLNRDLPKFDFHPPLEITAVAGDVLFYDYLCAHAGSINNGVSPRIAFNHKW
jgi:ectoine hydroxylase-related dioxygenase (phytanoyl-CoA dioxygenase family)